MNYLESFIALKSIAPTVFYIFIFAFAAGFATFLNVLLFRMPILMDNMFIESCVAFLDSKGISSKGLETKNERYNTLWGRSYCPSCGKLIPMYNNIPVISWLIQLGKSRCCKKPISIRYIAWELIFPSACVALFYNYDFYHAVGLSVFLYFGIAASHIDLKMKIIPDSYVFILISVGLILANSEITINVSDAVTSIITVATSLFLISYSLAKIKPLLVLGEGDIKLISAVSAWIGFSSKMDSGVLYFQLFILLMVVTFVLFEIVLRIKGKEKHEGVPMAPSIMISGFLVLLLMYL